MFSGILTHYFTKFLLICHFSPNVHVFEFKLSFPFLPWNKPLSESKSVTLLVIIANPLYSESEFKDRCLRGASCSEDDIN